MHSSQLGPLETPYKIRALAKVIHDAAKTDEQFPVVFAHGQFDRAALSRILLDLGYTLSGTEIEQFEASYQEYSQQLRGVDLSQLAKSRVVEALKLTTAIDSEANIAGIALSRILESVIHTHVFLLSIALTEISSQHSELFRIFMEGICRLLSRMLRRVQFRLDKRREALPHDELRELVELDSTLRLQVQHMEWFVDAAKQSLFFDASKCISDVSALDVWCRFVGNNVPACSTAKFAPALVAFPSWAHTPIMKALSYKDCGVVSVFSLVRLLKIWGPFSLLHKNFHKDLAFNIICFDKTTEVMAMDMACLPRGSFSCTMSHTVGHLDLQFVTPSGQVRKIVVGRDFGSWVLTGISIEDFETVCDACQAFPELLQTACGENYTPPQLSVEERNDSFSILHRACFRNNVAYVKKLLDCGSSVLVNTAVADPSINATLCWTPMMCAVNNPNSDPYEVIKMLAELGGNVNFIDAEGRTPLYYAIANRYSKAVSVIKGLSPNIQASPTTNPVLMALGAHFYNIDPADNLRLCGVVPSVDIVNELLLCVNDTAIVDIALQIINGKLHGEDAAPPPQWDFEGAPRKWLTDAQREENVQSVQRHTRLCVERTATVRGVLRALQAHRFFLSCQALKKSFEQRESPPSNPVSN